MRKYSYVYGSLAVFTVAKANLILFMNLNLLLLKFEVPNHKRLQCFAILACLDCIIVKINELCFPLLLLLCIWHSSMLINSD